LAKRGLFTDVGLVRLFLIGNHNGSGKQAVAEAVAGSVPSYAIIDHVGVGLPRGSNLPNLDPIAFDKIGDAAFHRALGDLAEVRQGLLANHNRVVVADVRAEHVHDSVRGGLFCQKSPGFMNCTIRLYPCAARAIGRERLRFAHGRNPDINVR
jgi:hypothetical protein